MKTKKMLARRDEFRLADWARSKVAKLGEMTMAEATAMAASDLSLELGQTSLRNVVNDLGLAVRFKITRGEGRIVGEGVKARVARLEHLVAHLYAKLGESMPNA
jgi:hypothetical protein